MPGHRKTKSPTIEVTITQEEEDHAVQSNSGGCLIADAIKREHPEFSMVSVDMATIRVTDRKRRERYTYLTPAAAQHVLLAFDQGWPLPTRELVIKRAVHIAPIRVVDASPSAQARSRQSSDRLEELEGRAAAGEKLTASEKGALTRLRNYWEGREDRPEPAAGASGYGARTIGVVGTQVVTRGGRPPVVGPDHPNLLRGRNRHYGARLADPGAAFRNAVEAEVANRLAAGQGT